MLKLLLKSNIHSTLQRRFNGETVPHSEACSISTMLLTNLQELVLSSISMSCPLVVCIQPLKCLKTLLWKS